MTSSPKDAASQASASKGFAEQAVAPYTAVGPVRTITLVPEHQRWVDQAVAEGRFETADDAVTFALDHFLPSAPDEDDDWMIPLIEEAMNDPRPSIPLEEFQNELAQRIARLNGK